jgi:preprotein translocase subunit SecA
MLLGMGDLTNAIGMMSDVGSDVDVREDDAGQKEIDEHRKAQYEERRAERKRLAEEYELFRGTGRNDTCPCGSGLKYKKCCQSKYNYI